MKIIFSVYDDINNPFYGGGGALAIHEIAKKLSKKHDVLIINSKYPKSQTETCFDGVNYKRIGIGLFGPKIDQIVFSVLIPFFAITQRYDLWFESFLPPLSGSFLPLISKRPIVGLAYFLNADMMQSKYHFPFKRLENFMLKNYKYIVALSDSLQKKITEVNKKANVAVIPMAIDDGFFLAKRKVLKPNFILYLGRLDTYNKGLDMLFPIMIKILKENPKMRFIVAGTGIKKEISSLQTIVRESRISDRVIFLGKVSEAKKIKLLSECLIYVLPSRYETFGIGMLEALSVGAPAIIFDIPGFEWIPNNTVVKVNSFNQHEFFKTLQNLIKDDKKLTVLSNKGRKFANQFRWKDVEKKYNTLIERVLDEENNNHEKN